MQGMAKQIDEFKAMKKDKAKRPDKSIYTYQSLRKLQAEEANVKEFKVKEAVFYVEALEIGGGSDLSEVISVSGDFVAAYSSKRMTTQLISVSSGQLVHVF